MSSFFLPKNELFQFVTWLLYTMLQIHNTGMKDMLYYENNRKKKDAKRTQCNLWVVCFDLYHLTWLYDF